MLTPIEVINLKIVNEKGNVLINGRVATSMYLPIGDVVTVADRQYVVTKREWRFSDSGIAYLYCHTKEKV